MARASASLPLLGIGKAAVLAAAFALTAAPSSPPELVASFSGARPGAQNRWSLAALEQLAAAVEAASREGLNPEDYQASRLAAAVRDGEASPDIDRLADEAALTLAHDYARGRIEDRARFDWFVRAAAPSPDELRRGLERARAAGQAGAWLKSLLPVSPAYAALRDALAQTPAGDPRRVPLLANMERWRWMPRNLGGGSYVWVNVPSQRVALMEGGGRSATFTAVVGAPDTPTPALASTIRAVVVNPWWTVPRSIIDKGELPSGARAERKGFVLVRDDAGDLHARQKPGAGNALGRVKIEFPNAHAIYLHDTPAKSAFARDDRARSHGCIRVQDIATLAEDLTDDPSPILDALAQEDTRTIRLDRRWPVWIVYFTMDLDEAGHLVALPDLYGRDAMLVDALNGIAPPPRLPQDGLVLADAAAVPAHHAAVRASVREEPDPPQVAGNDAPTEPSDPRPAADDTSSAAPSTGDPEPPAPN